MSKVIAFLKKALFVIKALFWADPHDAASKSTGQDLDLLESFTSTSSLGTPYERFAREAAIVMRGREVEDERYPLGRKDAKLRRELDALTGPDYEINGISIQAELMTISSQLEQLYIERQLLSHPWFVERFIAGEFGEDVKAAVRENGAMCPDLSKGFVKAYPA
jgi:hypothetical protein